MTLIECKDVQMSYEGKKVISDISFSLGGGEFLSIVGENGSGKSTLMKGILGLKQYDSGSITYNGITPSMIGYLPQQTPVQRDFPATVCEVVRSGCINKMGMRPFYTKAEKSRADHAMEQMQLLDIKKRCYRDLSGGQQQRVLLARAICATEKLLLLDEPVAGLDPKMTSAMYETVEQLHKSGVSIIMISHDIPSAVTYSDKILHISAGGSFFGKTNDYLTSEIYSKFS